MPSEQKEDRSGTIKRGQHPVVVPIEMLAAGHVSISNKNALPRRRQTEKYLQNCSGASRVSSSPQSTCSALQHSKNQGSAWDPEYRPLSRRVGPLMNR